jgi:hypothetical protein
MGEAYQVATLIRVGVVGLVIVLALALLIAGTLVQPEKRRRFLLWCVGVYAAGWTVFVLYNTLMLTKYLIKMMHG